MRPWKLLVFALLILGPLPTQVGSGAILDPGLQPMPVILRHYEVFSCKDWRRLMRRRSHLPAMNADSVKRIWLQPLCDAFPRVASHRQEQTKVFLGTIVVLSPSTPGHHPPADLRNT